SPPPDKDKASPVLAAALIAYTVVLAVAAASEIFDLGWFDWLVRYP
ncbi:MAG: hypothetical protein HY720_15395, partial [Planctomycetes bacterium]|nr:hypothetical protein [Planctomycetota bacterium]